MMYDIPRHLQSYDVAKAMAASGCCTKPNPNSGHTRCSKRCVVVSVLVLLLLTILAGVGTCLLSYYACPENGSPTESSMTQDAVTELATDLATTEIFNSTPEEAFTTEVTEEASTDLPPFLRFTEKNVDDQRQEVTSEYPTYLSTLHIPENEITITPAFGDSGTTEGIGVPTCPELQCMDGKCILVSQLHDGVVDCADGTDEPNFGKIGT